MSISSQQSFISISITITKKRYRSSLRLWPISRMERDRKAVADAAALKALRAPIPREVTHPHRIRPQ
jgi:hypothetical protein